MKKSPIAPLFETDAYKLSHRLAYPQGTEYIYSNFTNRASRIKGVNHVVAFGLQAFIQNFLMDAWEDFFATDEDTVVKLYEERYQNIMGPGEVDSTHVRKLHQKGYLPLHIKAVKEGTLVPLQVPTLTVENTDPEFYWLTNYIETALSASLWHPSTNATKSMYARFLLENWAERTGANKDFVTWQWHDFSFRGQTSIETACASGAAHLLSFTGTDTLGAIEWVNYFYPGDNGFIGGSVNATEHSVMTARGPEGEHETYAELLKTYPTGILSVVSDTYDLWNVLTNIVPSLKTQIMERDGKLVIRPDSGNPVDILCGTVEYFNEATTPEEKGVVQLLWETFRGTINERGYKTLDQHIGVIYGDSITLERADEIFTRLERKGFTSDNVVFGAGSYFFQGNVTRDTFHSAMKATWIQVNGEGFDMMKDPITANGSKKSATGRLAVLRNADNELTLVEKATPQQEEKSELQTVWKDGQFVRKQAYAEVRELLKEEIKRVYNR